jgi:hypothetical protein
VTAAQASSERGQQVRWTVSAWTTGATATAAAITLQASPAASGTASFSFGCGKSDGTSSCDLGAVDPQSAHRQLQAQVTVPVAASAVKSVSLTVTGTAPALPTAARASASVAITAPGTAATTQTAPATPSQAPQPPSQAPQPPLPPQAPQPPMTVISPLPVGSLPGLPSVGLPPAGLPPAGLPPLAPGTTQSQAGSAAGLFPTVNPSPMPSFPSVGGARRVADTSALPAGASVVNAQLAGLAALALAFVLAVTRLSIRRPAGQAADQPGTEAAQPKTESGPDTEESKKPGTGKPDA